MTRDRRIWSPGDILSVVVRAHEGRPVFATEEDRGFLVRRTADVLVPGSTEFLASDVARCAAGRGNGDPGSA